MRTVGLFRPYGWRLALLVVLVAGMAALDLLPALLIGLIVDEPFSGDFDARRTVVLGGAVAGMYFGSAVLSALVALVNSTIGHDIMFSLRERLHTHVQSLSLRFFTSARTGEILSRVSTDVNSVEAAVTGSFTEVLNSSILLTFALALMFSLDWRLSLVAALVMVVWSVPTMLVGRYMRGLQRDWAEEFAGLSAHLEETMSVSGSLLVRAFGRQEFESERFAEESGELRRLAVRRRVVGRMFEAATRLFGSLAIGFVYWIGSQWIASGQMTVGTVVAFAVLSQRAFGPMASMARANTTLIAALALFERIFEYLDLRVDVDQKVDAIDLKAPTGNVTFDRVSFSYDGSSAPALRDISFELRAGEMVALVGPSGAGKTSVTYLLQRFYDPQQGRVLLDGHDLRDLTLDSLTRAVGTVMQDTTLFHTTLADNIRYGRLDATDQEVRDAASIAALDDLLARLPDGLETVVGERGYRLSGGEKQRVAIARVVLKDPPLLIMDEATSSLDSRLERDIREATARLAQGRTTVVIAHRLSTVAAADVIFVLSDGRIVERGSHDELLRGEGLYASLYYEQFAADTPPAAASARRF